MDKQLRRLERQAAAGDKEAEARLVALKRRSRAFVNWRELLKQWLERRKKKMSNKLLCNKCSQMMFTCDVGTCGCGGILSSGAFKHCGQCAAQLNQCQACKATLFDLEKLAKDKKTLDTILRRVENDDIVDEDGSPV